MMLIAAGIGIVWFIYEGSRPIVRGPAIDLVIPYGTSARGVAAMIRQSGIDIHEGMFLMHARWEGVHRHLKAGVYRVETGLTKKQFLARLAGHDPSQTEIRILEGWTVKQAIEAMAKNPELRFDLGPFKKDQDLAKALDMPEGHPEGWLYPDVYFVPKGTAASEVLKRSTQLQQGFVKAEWDKRREGLPYRSPYEALIVASIVEKETQFPGDREKVAAVFANRLKTGMPLQADPTVIYGLGAAFNGDITRAHLKKDTPYNTYTRKKLPPTPISNPGLRALRAVMNPAETKAVYFVARGDGSSEFSETLKDHNTAVARLIRKISGEKK